MKAIRQFLEGKLRGPRASGWLKRCGIDPVRYWLLVDLFGELSERREMFSQLGRDGMAMKKAAWLYFAFSALMVIPFLLVEQTPATFFLTFQAVTAFLLLSMLLPETSNSLVNPVEGLVLAHQPIDGATYTAAKLTHLLRIILYLVPGVSLIPAFAGLFLKGAPWYYPLLHIGTAFGIGLVLGFLCCALFGWLIRFVAPARLKAAGFAAEMMPWTAYLFFQFAGQTRLRFRIPRSLPIQGAPVRVAIASFTLLAITAVVLGIRSLSGDYLARVAAIAHAGSGGKIKVRRSRLGELVARCCGGPAALAGFAYVSRMMLRDWQFRRQLIPLIPMTVMSFVGAFQSVRVSPFSGRFTWIHLLPHAFGIAFFLICSILVYGNDHKGSWFFLLAPGGAFHGFVRGVWARLFSLIVVPHLALLAVLAWYWPWRDAALFSAYSLAAAAVYLGLELRLIEGMPFSKQPEGTSNPFVIPMMLLGGAAMAAAVGLQYFLLFRSPLAVAAATALLCIASWLLTRKSLESFELAIRFHLGVLSAETKGIYKEIN